MSKKRTRLKFDRFRVAFSLALSAAFLFAVRAQIFEPPENRWRDALHSFRGMRTGDPRVVIVAIDDKSIAEVGQFPWPRSMYAPLLDGLKAAQAKVIGFDMLIMEPSETAEDHALAQATRRAGNVVHAVDLDMDRINQNLGHYSFRFPIDPVRKAAAGHGFVYTGFLLDGDGSLRRVPLMAPQRRPETSDSFSAEGVLQDPGRIPGFGTAILARYEGRDPDEYVRRFGNSVRLNLAGERSWSEPHPSGAKVKGKPLMVVRQQHGYTRISAIDVMSRSLTEDQRRALKGAIALVGSTAVGAYDHYPTPFSELTPGVEIWANVIDNLAHDRFLKPAPRLAAYALPVAAIALSVFLIRLSPLAGSLAASGAMLAWMLVSYVLFLSNRLVDFVAPVSALAASFVVLLVQRVLHEHNEKRWIKNTFSQYLSHKVVDSLVTHPEKLRLGGEKRDMSVMFIDIAKFTSISEKMDPETLTHFLNRYLTSLTNVILKHDGVVDKYIGDCVMAFWNAPMDQARHREFACLTAVDCLKATEALNKELVGRDLPHPIGIRIGLNAGPAVVGNMGSETRFSYTVIGDTVNLASRLEGANKFFGSSVLASESAFEGCEDKFEARELGRLRVVGKENPIKVYEIWDAKGRLDPEKGELLDLFAEGLGLYYRHRFTESEERFTQILSRRPDDTPSKLYLHECRRWLTQPIPKDWDGVFNLTSK